MSELKTPAHRLAKAKQRNRARRNEAHITRKKVFACRIREMRDSLNLTMKDVAKELGMSQAGLSSIEHGTDPQLTTAFKLCKFFGCKVDDIWKNLLEKRTQ